ncbi:threonyl-tRNA synthetase [Anaerobranca californiensis DSM 14826]|jgi:threonyl-tRNA synthetase|uniref:Threonine--tRNA ligase n=1 Tax=Anaerobranca californiensis DSM 14826 TaxID=1120989 RepID=A0A1M6PSP9_9FIRM|nr:threonine--tRNA ligase [Anaerobranca californiensis]SHK10918.1 threonyl-tRNA synthetase [Anaerobranca californiensis DSM 14826]
MIKVTLKDGSVREYKKGVTVEEIAKDISPRLAKEALAGRVNGKLVDLNFKLENDSTLDIITFDSPEGEDIYRHSSAHIMAQAVSELFPGVKLAIGPSIKDGFYYDFMVDKPFTPDDLEKIEEKMQEIIKRDLPFKRHVISRDEAIKFFKEIGQDFKVELIEGLSTDEEISYYQQGEFVDLCSGPHIPSTGKLKAFKLLNVAGAYWRGDEKNPTLQRIYGTSFPKKSMLDEYLYRLEEAKKRDHRKLGKELDLFSFSEEAPGMAFYHPKGMILRNEIINFWREKHKEYGYEEIQTPLLMNQRLWERSGHWQNYRENMYFTEVDNETFAIKPMNCPGAMLVYKTSHHSYRDLPLRLAELGLVHRRELSGALHGMMRVRAFTQDDAHIFMLPEQIEEEIGKIMDLIDDVYKVFGYSYRVELSTKPEKAIGSDEIWEIATNALKKVLENRKMDYVVNEGDGAFYGPKIDFHIEDCLGRSWQCGTIQLDFMLPERFDLTYVGEDGQKHRPVVVHRVVLGAIDRFIGLLVEHVGGAFPLWLAPEQVRIIAISERHIPYCKELEKKLKSKGIRVWVDGRNEKIGYKIREGQLQKIPYMLVVGDKEVETEEVNVRKRGEGEIGAKKVEELINDLLEEIKNKR